MRDKEVRLFRQKTENTQQLKNALLESPFIFDKVSTLYMSYLYSINLSLYTKCSSKVKMNIRNILQQFMLCTIMLKNYFV